MDLNQSVSNSLTLGVAVDNNQIEVTINLKYACKPVGDASPWRPLQPVEVGRDNVKVYVEPTRKGGNVPTDWLVGRSIGEKERSGRDQLANESWDPTGFVR
ncbi:MAG: hypothetical protein ACRDK4_14045 [Solirubrobacteraceae bacterium]